MKGLASNLAVFGTLALAHSTLAQVPETASGSVKVSEKAAPTREGIFLLNGKVMILKDGGLAPLREDITLGNGTKVSTSGQVTLRDGTSVQLAAGQMVGNDGLIATLRGTTNATGTVDVSNPAAEPETTVPASESDMNR